MGPRLDLAISLGKTVAQIAAELSPVPGLAPAVDVFCGIIQLCDNVVVNKLAARQLRDRCHTLLLAIRDSDRDVPSENIQDALDATQKCFLDIRTRMHDWASISKFQAFTRQKDIAQDISRCHDAISDCLSRFQLVSHMELHEWKHEFSISTKQDHIEVMEYLSEIQNSQNITHGAISETTDLVRDMMGMMQRLLGENVEAQSRTFSGLSSNLYQLQVQSGQLLPNFNLKSGEVTRVGGHPVSGSSAMDIYEGLYLQREKVAIKVIRAVNSNEHSLRRFMREVKIWGEIWKVDRGKHVLPFYGFCQEDGPYPYMISPWQKNGSAINYVKNNDNAVDYKRLISGIALGIEVLHNMTPPVVHGDLKATNIVIDTWGNPLIADFGLSQIVEDITGIPFTQSRGVSDSYRWFAPEVCVGAGVLSIASDIYAFAMTTLELMTHKQPYSNIKHTTEVVIRSAKGERPPRPMEPRVAARGLNDDLWCLMNECWELEPSSRPYIKGVLARLPT